MMMLLHEVIRYQSAHMLLLLKQKYAPIDQQLSLDHYRRYINEILQFSLMHEFLHAMQTATFCGQQGRISRTVRAILSGQPGISAGQRVLRPTDQYYSLFQKKAMLSQSVQ